MSSQEKTKFRGKAIEEAESICSSDKETNSGIIFIGTIHISLNCSTTSLTLSTFFKSKEIAKSLIGVKRKQPTIDKGRIDKGITIGPSKGSRPQKVILEKPTVELKKTHSMPNLQGEPHKWFINGTYLKKYFPTMWEMLDTTQRIRLILQLTMA